MKNRPVILLGAGGHSRVLAEILQTLEAEIIGVTDPDPNLQCKNIMGVPVLGDDTIIANHDAGEIVLVNGLGTVGRTQKRRELFETFKREGYLFRSVIHPRAIISPSAVIGEGVQVMAGAVVQTLTVIGDNSIINTRACVDHDCMIGKHVHIAPGVTISGGVTIKSGALIGAGAAILQGITVGANSLVAAGAAVIRDVPDGATVMGVPAKVVKQ